MKVISIVIEVAAETTFLRVDTDIEFASMQYFGSKRTKRNYF